MGSMSLKELNEFSYKCVLNIEKYLSYIFKVYEDKPVDNIEINPEGTLIIHFSDGVTRNAIYRFWEKDSDIGKLSCVTPRIDNDEFSPISIYDYFITGFRNSDGNILEFYILNWKKISKYFYKTLFPEGFVKDSKKFYMGRMIYYPKFEINGDAFLQIPILNDNITKDSIEKLNKSFIAYRSI